jgi:hypothetical protein
VMPTLGIRLWVALATMTAGCFDVHTVDPGRRLIDNFENLDGDPTDPSFERWACRPVDETHQMGSNDCNISSIENHESVLHLGARLFPGNEMFKRAELITSAEQPQDLTPYARFLFSWKLVSGDPPLSAATLLKVQLTCTSIRDADGRVSTNPCVVKTVLDSYDPDRNSDWNGPLPLELSDFAPPEGFLPKPNLQGCLARVDGIKITVQSDSSALASFDLYVDDIGLEPKK